MMERAPNNAIIHLIVRHEKSDFNSIMEQKRKVNAKMSHLNLNIFSVRLYGVKRPRR